MSYSSCRSVSRGFLNLEGGDPESDSSQVSFLSQAPEQAKIQACPSHHEFTRSEALLPRQVSC